MRELSRILIYGNAQERVYACSKSFLHFAAFYFSDFFDYQIPVFHKDFYRDAEKLGVNELNEVCWVAFRESAKTSIAKIFIIWCICFQKKKYINVDSYDKANAEATLFDIITLLQSNKKIISDFGQMYVELRRKQEVKLKRVSGFITANKIKVEAFSTQESTRGRVYLQHRPDLFVLDDIENSKTRISQPITKRIIEHVDEMKAGLSPTGGILYLGNYITEIGVINHVMNVVAKNPKGMVRNVPVVSSRGEIAWKDKYVLTDVEAAEKNKDIADPRKVKISLETKRRELGEASYRENMLNDPVSAGEPFFDRRKIDLEIARANPPLEEIAGQKIWSRYNPAHRYAIGADTSMGVGLDANAAVCIDFSSVPAKVCSTYANDKITPDIFAYELKRQGEKYGECLIAPEANGESGGACVNELKRIYKRVFRAAKTGTLHDTQTEKVGWYTNSATKPEMMYQLKSAYEDGKLEIPDEILLKEMRAYTKIDLSQREKPLETTRHFDLLLALAIAWAMREWATVPAASRKPFKQPDYEPPSPYGDKYVDKKMGAV